MGQIIDRQAKLTSTTTVRMEGVKSNSVNHQSCDEACNSEVKIMQPPRPITYLDIGANSAQPNLDRDLENDSRYKVLGLKHITAFDRRLNTAIVLPMALVGANIYNKRPHFPFIPVYLALAVSGYFIGDFSDRYHKRKRLQDDLVVWDYVRRHPEDFPEVFERPKTYGEVILPWNPAR
ncbi:hypothetical protein GJ496_004560 [Pomphorhynchus laevis]|nr:hypothetical protein GJ496_004560 [Pomphorhynchus laevis]